MPLLFPQRKGDILSNLMELDKHKLGGSSLKPDASYRQYIKESARLIDQMKQAKHQDHPVQASDVQGTSQGKK